MLESKPILTSGEKRPLKKKLTNILKEQNVDNARNVADVLLDMGIVAKNEPKLESLTVAYLPLLRHSQANWILNLAYNLTRLSGNNSTILASTSRASSPYPKSGVIPTN